MRSARAGAARNRRLARDVYLGVVAVDDGAGRTVDHVVEMVRMPDDTFRYIVEEPIWAVKKRDTLDSVMRRVAASLEHVISRYSEQWFLFHDLWNIEQDRKLAVTMAFGAAPSDTQVTTARQAHE